MEGFDASGWAVTPPFKDTFWKVLEHRGVRFTEVSNPPSTTRSPWTRRRWWKS